MYYTCYMHVLSILQVRWFRRDVGDGERRTFVDDPNASHLAIPNGGFLFIGGAPGRYLGLYLQLLGSIIETRGAICKLLSWSDVVLYK